MRQVAIVVEGQSEKLFVERILAPHLAPGDVYPQAIITKTSVTGRGGGGWRGYRDQLGVLVGQSHWDMVTTMIDFYRSPTGMPGRDLTGSDVVTTVAIQEAALREAFDPEGTTRFHPFLMLHEFEALVLSAASLQDRVLGDQRAAAEIARWVDDASGNPELINGGPNTAPSKRLEGLFQDYVKTASGIEILMGAPFDEVRARCPRFNGWVEDMTAC